MDVSSSELLALVERQLNSFWGVSRRELDVLSHVLPGALAKIEICFSTLSNKYCNRNGGGYFSPYHADSYCVYLYHLAKELYEKERDWIDLADRIYYLNRVMHGVDLFYGVDLPTIFWVGHPLGAVIGRGSFGDYFSFSQGCNVGNSKGNYPVLGHHVHMYPRSAVLGSCKVGNFCVLASGTIVKNQDVPSNSLVFGESPDLTFKPLEESYYYTLVQFKEDQVYV